MARGERHRLVAAGAALTGAAVAAGVWLAWPALASSSPSTGCAPAVQVSGPALAPHRLTRPLSGTAVKVSCNAPAVQVSGPTSPTPAG
jgi:hypothetical protein